MKTKILLLILSFAGLAAKSFGYTNGDDVPLRSYVSLRYDLPDIPGCDSIIIKPIEDKATLPAKIVYKYDAQNNMIEKIIYDRESATGKWNPYLKYVYSYNSNGRMISKRFFEWTTTYNGQTVNDWMLWTETQFDIYGNITIYTEYNGDWNNRICWYGMVNLYEYNAEGKILLNTLYYWDSDSQKWNTNPEERTEYTYDMRGNLIVKNTLKRGENGGWIQYVPRFVYEYDSENRETRETWYNSISGPTLNDPGKKWETEYDNQGRKTFYTEYKMMDRGWNMENFKAYTYNSQGKETLMEYYSKILLGYIGTNPPVPVYTGDLKEKYNIATIYDSKGQISHQTETDFNYEVVESGGQYIITSVTPSRQWETTCYYRNGTGIDLINSSTRISISPNPATDLITVSGLQSNEALHFYTINGQLLFSHEINNETEHITISYLPAGIYIMKTNDGQSIKWIKK